MLNYNDIKERVYIVLEGEPYEVLESSIKKKNRQKPTNQTKLRNLISGSVKQVAFHQSDVVEPADIDRNKITYLFQKPNRQAGTVEFWFCESGNKGNRFMVDGNILGDKVKFMKENTDVDALYFGDQIIGIDLPVKVSLKVVEAPPAVKGNTATGATKTIKLETGAEVNAPLFIKEGDVVSVKVETGEYCERV